jgi:hypothetical protein
MKTNISRRDLYAFGEPFGDGATTSKVGGGRIYGMGGGGGGNTTQSTGTTYTSNIPEYAKEYTNTMLGATQKQLFNMEGNEITSFKPYQPYSTNASDYVAGFSPLQQQQQQMVGGMQVPGELQGAADVTRAGIMGAADVGSQARAFNPMAQQAAGIGQQYQNMATDPYAMSAYMNPYMQNVVATQQREAGRQADIATTGRNAQAAQAGAFGGSRQAIMDAEAARNLAIQKGDIQAQGLNSAFQQAQQAQQYGAGLGLQGLQAGAGIYGQGLSAQQAAINQAMQGANQYGAIGSQKLQTEQGIAGLKGQVGAQQQSMEQQKINQSIQDYANAQQYPLMQLGVMSNMLRGLPMQASSTNQYVAAPNALTQGIGAVGAYNALSGMNATPKAAGGVISMAEGGIAGIPQYNVGGEIENQLENMSVEELARQAKESSSPTIRGIAQRLLKEKQMEQGAGGLPQMAGGGIIAFKKGETVSGPEEEATSTAGNFFRDIGDYVKRQQAQSLALQQDNRNAGNAQRDIEQTKVGLFEAVTPSQRAERERQVQMLKGYQNKKPESQFTLASAPAAPTAVPDASPAAAARDQDRLMAARSITSVPAPAAAPAPTRQAATPTAAPPAAPTGQGIASVPAPAEASPFADIQKAIADQQALASRSDASAVKDIRATSPENIAAAEQRKNIMDERANAKDDAERQRSMRMAQFFAAWGSTPGPTLAAGLVALNKTLPDLIMDDKDFKKAKRDLDKAMYDIDNSIRLEDLGYAKEARESKEKAANRVAQLQAHLTSAQANAATAKTSAESSKYSADSRLKEANIQAASSGADRQANRESRDEQKKYGQYQESLRLAEVVRDKTSKAESDPTHVKDLATIKTAELAASQNNEKVPDILKPGYDKAVKDVKARENGWTTARNKADNVVVNAAKRAGVSPEVSETTMSMADVQATATASGKTVAEVRAAAERAGFKIK